MLGSSFWTCVLGFAVVGVRRDTKAWASGQELAVLGGFAIVILALAAITVRRT